MLLSTPDSQIPLQVFEISTWQRVSASAPTDVRQEPYRVLRYQIRPAGTSPPAVVDHQGRNPGEREYSTFPRRD